MSKSKLTICVPCYERPKRTIRALESVLAQDMNGWEAYFVGDGCHKFSNMCDEGVFEEYIKRAEENGNKLIIKNLEHSGGWGYNVRNYIFRTPIVSTLCF